MKKASLLRRSLSIAAAAAMLVSVLAIQAFAAPITTGTEVRVAVSELYIRSGPGKEYQEVGVLRNGYTTRIRETNNGWGKIDAGWINLEYLETVRPTSNNAAIGYVQTSSLNIRQGPGLQYPVCGDLENGHRVTITDVVGGWGKIDGGWVDLDYIGSYVGSNSSNTNNDYVSNGSNSIVRSNVRVTADHLNVRQGPGTGYSRIGQMDYGTTTDLLEIRGNWGRTRQGWICLDYTTTTSINNSSSNKTISAGSRVEVTADNLNVRSGAGLQYPSNGMLQQGYQTTIREISGSWGKIDSGWISLDYVRVV